MRLTEKEKKRRQRELRKRGGRVISVEIVNWEAWGEILSDEGLLLGSVVNDQTIRLATEKFIWKLCRDRRAERAEQQLADIRSPVTGLIDREIGPYDGSQLVKAEDIHKPNILDTFQWVPTLDDDE